MICLSINIAFDSVRVLFSNVVSSIFSGHIQGERKMYQQTKRRRFCTARKEKIPSEHRLSESWFPSYGLLKIKENSQSTHLELQRWTLHI
jgi:hypothetical protein